MSPLDDILALVENISTLSKTLPASVPLGTEHDKIYRVLNLEEGETPYATYNRRFDLLFKEHNDCRDKTGRFHYIRRGPHGMTKLCAYLKNVDWADANLPLDLELERFLAAPKVFGHGDPNTPLLWWKLYHHEFPVIALMACDFLAIPGTSVSVERLFSKSRHLCTDVQSSLRATTIMTAMMTKCWIKQGLLKFTAAKTQPRRS